jgi:Tfp pilus assembly protein PilF
MALVFYLGKLLWPVRLLPIYPRWEVDPPTLWQFSPWLVIAAAAVVFWRYRRTWGRDAMMAFGFFFIMVLPVLGFVKIAFMRITWVSDHFVHLPMIGPVALAAAMAAGAIQSLRGVSKTLLTASVAVVLCLLTMASRSYAAVWKNEDELWSHTLKSNWSAWQAHSRFGAREFARGNLQSALRHFTEGVRLRPDLAETHNNLASVLLRLGDAVGGVVHMRRALDNGPHLAGIRMNYTATLLNLGRTDEAISQYEILRRDLPESPVVAYNLGILLRNAGRSAEARECFLEALRLKPDFKKSQIALEGLDQKTGDSK